MKILHYVTGLNNGGIETMLVNLVNVQVKEHDVSLMVLTDNILDSLKNRLAPEVHLLLIKKPVGSKNILYLLKANWLYWKLKPDVFHFHEHNSSIFFPFKRKNEKRLATIHSVYPTKWNNSINEYIAISQCVKDFFEKQTGKNNCVVCYNGINLTAFREKTDYSKKPSRFLSIGRLYPSKGMDIVIKALVCLKKQKRLCEFIVEIWGEGMDRPRIEEMIHANCLEEFVVLKGNVDSQYVESHICDYDCVIQASRHEGFGLTAIEAMVTGVPTILSDIEGYKEVSRDGEYSLLFQPEDAGDLAKKILELVDNYENAVNRAQKAKNYVHENYSIENLNRNLEIIYSNS